ncbi:MAG: molybdopterin molybdotransferase MoeA [Anaerolineae bacterium]
MSDLLNVDEALERILATIQPLAAEQVALRAALGRVLAEDVHAPLSLPPFPNSSMDGYAVKAGDTADATTRQPALIRVAMDIRAGDAPTQTLEAGQAARIMTGAPLPAGADAVVPVEDTDGTWDIDGPLPESVRIFARVVPGTNVRPVGEDIQQGQFVLGAGARLRPQDMGVLAALGQAQVRVARRPRVALLTSGDELVSVEEDLAPGKIRDANSYTLAGLVEENGGEALVLPIARDTLAEVRNLFLSALALQPDMIVSSAGVSVGAADLVRTVLAELGEIGFWRINLRPGKPLAFGRLQGVPFFGLPGNPVSAMITFDVLVRPALLRQQGTEKEWPMVLAATEEPMMSDGRRSYVRVKLRSVDGAWLASSTGTQSSGALMSMVVADGLMIIPEEMTRVPAGTVLPVRLLR